MVIDSFGRRQYDTQHLRNVVPVQIELQDFQLYFIVFGLFFRGFWKFLKFGWYKSRFLKILKTVEFPGEENDNVTDL